MTLKDTLLGKKERKQHVCAELGIKSPKQVLLVGVYGEDRDLVEHLQTGCREYGHEIQLVVLTEATEASLWEAVDVLIILEQHTESFVWEYCKKYLLVPVVQGKSAWNTWVTEYEPTKEEGNGFHFGNKNVWSIFAAIIRAMETKRFSYDWNTLLKRIYG